MAENLYSLLLHARERNSEGIFFSQNGRDYSYGEVLEKTLYFEKYFLGRGVGFSGRVLINLPNIPELVFAVFASHKIGAIPVLVNPMARRHELQCYADIVRPSLVVAKSESREHFDLARQGSASMQFLFVDRDECMEEVFARPLQKTDYRDYAAVDENHPALIIFTSADDGVPGGAMITHRGILETAHLSGEFSISRDDVFVAALPLFHAFGLTTSLFLPLYNFCRVLLIDKFSVKKIASLLMEGEATIFCGVPIMFEVLGRVLRKTPGILRMRSWISGGEAISLALQRQYRDELGIEIQQGYGLTEASPIVTWNITGKENRHGSIGLPMSYNTVKLVVNEKEDEKKGEIFVKGTNVVPGYYKNPEKSVAHIKGGWLKTGDIAEKDSDGYFYIRGRAKDMILRNGFNVYPKEVRNIFLRHPEIQEAEAEGCVNITEDFSGKDSLRVKIWRKPGSALTEKTLREWCADNISAYKIPDVIEVV